MTDTNSPRPELSKKPASAIDDALESSLSTGSAVRPAPGAPLKKQWDKDLEAQLEEALKDFGAQSFNEEPPVTASIRRDRGDDRSKKPGQAERPGSRSHHVPRFDSPKPEKKIGKVIAVRGKNVFVDLGAKSEGVVALDRFGENPPQPGDKLEVVIDRFDEDEGILLLSLKGDTVEASWENLRPGLVVEARVDKVNKGGLEVVVDGIRGFLPIGQIDINHVLDASIYLNHKFAVVVTEADQRNKNLVVSRREQLERERAEARAKTWTELAEGQVRKGVVRSLKEYGAFVDIGGVDGLLHVGDTSWTRVKDISALLKVGQEVEVKILKIDRETQKIGLGLKQLTSSPWDLVDVHYARGMTVPGKVTRLMEFGAFVEIEPGVEGLVHISEISPNRVRRVADILKPDQEVEVRILSIDSEAKKIALSLRPLAETKPSTVDEEEADESPRPPKPEPKIPLKGGIGGGNPFSALLRDAKNPSSRDNQT